MSKKGLPIFLMVALLLISLMLTGCPKEDEEEGIKIAKEIFLYTSTPTPEPMPTPTPMPEVKVGLHFTEDDIELINDEWLPMNWKISNFPGHYATYINYNWLVDKSQLIYEFRPLDMDEDEAKEVFGKKMFDKIPAQAYHSGAWAGETKADGGSLEASLNIVTYNEIFSVYITFVVAGADPLTAIKALQDRHWPNDIIIDALVKGQLAVDGIAYYYQTKESEISKTWSLGPETLLVYGMYKDLYSDDPSFTESTSDDYSSSSMGVSYLMKLDDGTTLSLPMAIQVWEGPGMFNMSLGARHIVE